MMRILLAHLILSSLIIFQVSYFADSSTQDKKISCYDENRNPVEWSIAYKTPKDPESVDPGIRVGSAYFYITPSSSSGWQRSEIPINNQESILGITTEPLYQNVTNDLAYVLYNDQPPQGPAIYRNGHTKGLVLASNSSALWLIHSVPHFPKPGPSFTYPVGGLENGQLFLCLTLNLTQVDNVGTVLQYTKPNIFNASIKNSFVQLLPKLNQVVNQNASKKTAPWYTTFSLNVNNLNFTIFVKGPKFRREIYADWISPSLGTGLDVQSWLSGTHPFQSNCSSSKFSVMNILSKDMNGDNFTTINDHSKWGIGINTSTVCITDLNRTKPQKSRGGIAACVQDQKIWTAFKNIVRSVQSCNSNTPRFDKYFRRVG